MQNGERASLTGQRLSDFQASKAELSDGGGDRANAGGLNMVLFIQVPNKQKERERSADDDDILYDPDVIAYCGSNVEDTVIGQG